MKRWYLSAGILAAVLGLFIIIFPTFWINLVVIILGLGAVGYGIYNLKFSKDVIEDELYKKITMIKSIVSIVIGVMSVLFPLAISNAAWTVMKIILIIYLISIAAVGFFSVSLLKYTDIDRKKYIFENLIMLGIAVVLILLSPKTLGVAIIRIVGIVAMVGGAGLIAFELITKNKEIVVAEVEVKDSNEAEVSEESKTADSVTEE